MNLFVYFEFCRPDILDLFKKLCPDVTIIQSTPLNDKNISAELNKIYRTNAKLLFNVAHMNICEDIVDKLKLAGFNVKLEDQFMICKEKRIILVPDENHVVQYRKCECGKNNIEILQPSNEKIITVNIKRPFSDRIILEVEDNT